MSQKIAPRKLILVFLVSCTMTATLTAQEKVSKKQFEKLVATKNVPLFVDGERVYRVSEVSKRAIVTHKPEPRYTEQARKKNTRGVVRMRIVLKADGGLRVIGVLKELKNGLTETALDAAVRIQFTPAELGGRPVSQVALLEYHYNTDE